MVGHAVDIQTQVSDGCAFRYRWRCACGRVGPWQASVATEHGTVERRPALCARAARNGGARHVAAMERSR